MHLRAHEGGARFTSRPLFVTHVNLQIHSVDSLAPPTPPPPPPAFPVRMMVLVDMRTMVLNFDLFFS